MGCKCDKIWIKSEKVYGHACTVLADRNRDCTIVDVGCKNRPHLHEIKRHLLRHNIRCKTIGIDDDPYDTEVDRFINKDVRDVRMPSTADVVVGRYVFHMCNTKTEFRDIIRASADILKKDGLMITDVYTYKMTKPRRKPVLQYMFTQSMTKKDALAHADMCYGKCYEKCPHGTTICMYTVYD